MSVITVKVYEDPSSAPEDKALWIDVDVHGWPVHPSKFVERILGLVHSIKQGKYREHLATVNGDAISALGYLVRSKKIDLPVQAVVVFLNGTESIANPMDSKGDFVYPWAEKGSYNIIDAGFNFRFH